LFGVMVECCRDLYADTVLYRKGDYHRYLAEFASGEKRKGAATAAHDAYKVCSNREPGILRL